MVGCLLLFRQWMKLGFLGTQITQPEITSILEAANILEEKTSAFFEQFKIMLAAIGKGRGKDHLRLLVDNRFLGVTTLLFTAVVSTLLFYWPFYRLFSGIDHHHLDQGVTRL